MSLFSPVCAGIDISKETLDIAASNKIEKFSISNDTDGFNSIITILVAERNPLYPAHSQNKKVLIV